MALMQEWITSTSRSYNAWAIIERNCAYLTLYLSFGTSDLFILKKGREREPDPIQQTDEADINLHMNFALPVGFPDETPCVAQPDACSYHPELWQHYQNHQGSSSVLPAFEATSAKSATANRSFEPDRNFVFFDSKPLLAVDSVIGATPSPFACNTASPSSVPLRLPTSESYTDQQSSTSSRSICSAATASNNSSVSADQILHRRSASQVSRVVKRDDAQRPRCPQCNNSFATISGRNKHLRFDCRIGKPTGEKNFVCPGCGRGFTRKHYQSQNHSQRCRLLNG